MRKIYLCALALMIGAISFAQNNKSTVVQEGIDAVSKVVQDGSSNRAIQYQRNREGLVDIYQKGNGNYANQDQNPIYQGNPANVVTENRGKEAVAKIKQIGNGNRAWQTQTWDNESAFAEQRGNNNTSRQLQKGAENIADVKQYDNGHTAIQNQYGRRVEAYINQSGANNRAKQTQNKGGFDDYAKAVQSGSNNYSEQTQMGKGKGRGPSNANYVYVNQSGNGNRAIQDQSNDLSNNQRNVAEIIQKGNNGLAIQDQYGTNGMQKIEQKNGSNNNGYQYQDAASELGDATLMQNGSGNWSQQWQYGMGNSSDVNQAGNNMWSKVTQTGSGNLNTVVQTN
ncbi:hypothetical protein LCM02_02280 [Lutimonas saemankumensis]|uniref:hypothetical protein n=1 Tax=Lutimonas saemankumensis TaxID=483016 RepID=UPI001CD629DB|nr:hypothetical protein [Lutimonas saemankumensis]MCA0931261.1 hypothetical protein [Lutimonas saemankumensis]